MASRTICSAGEKRGGFNRSTMRPILGFLEPLKIKSVPYSVPYFRNIVPYSEVPYSDRTCNVFPTKVPERPSSRFAIKRVGPLAANAFMNWDQGPSCAFRTGTKQMHMVGHSDTMHRALYQIALFSSLMSVRLKRSIKKKSFGASKNTYLAIMASLHNMVRGVR